MLQIWPMVWAREVYELVALVLAVEERFAGVKLVDDAADGPHVDGGANSTAEDDLRGSIVARLDVHVLVALVEEGASEIGYDDSFVDRVFEQDVVGLEVGVDDPDIWQGEHGETQEQLPSENPGHPKRESVAVLTYGKVEQGLGQVLQYETIARAFLEIVQKSDYGRGSLRFYRSTWWVRRFCSAAAGCGPLGGLGPSMCPRDFGICRF
jgi:hypothetical protein